MSGCLSLMCCSTLATSSSSSPPRTVSPHGQSTCFAIAPPLGCRTILRRGLLDAQRHQRLLRRLLLRRLLRLTGADADLLPVDHGGAREATVVWRPFDVEHRVGDGLPPARGRLPELRLVIDVARQPALR